MNYLEIDCRWLLMVEYVNWWLMVVDDVNWWLQMVFPLYFTQFTQFDEQYSSNIKISKYQISVIIKSFIYRSNSIHQISKYQNIKYQLLFTLPKFLLKISKLFIYKCTIDNYISFCFLFSLCFFLGPFFYMPSIDISWSTSSSPSASSWVLSSSLPF